ncbi:hypothetical protein ONZ45_g11968 [Pleurotus djamor]|nr:hypothetical protein ONZ45_g11968 [Pleurotus djamor]
MVIFTQADIDAQRVIDSEIHKYRTLIQSLCARRNTHSAISRLPHEILSHVLVEYKATLDSELRPEEATTIHSKYPYAGSTRSSRDAKALLQAYLGKLLDVTHVCSLWRHVALDSASFWSTVVSDRRGWVDRTFGRAKLAPLTVVGPLGKLYVRHSAVDVLSVVMDASGRFEDVDITLRPVDMRRLAFCSVVFPTATTTTTTTTTATTTGEETKNLKTVIPREAPLLRSISIFYDTSDDDEHTYHREEDYKPRKLPFPWTSLTSLTSLTLQHLIPISVPSMPALTHLVIRIHDYVDFRCLSVPRVVDVLRNTPVLESLSVSRISSDDAAVITPPDAQLIHLPNLRDLHITFQYLRESVLFAFLDIPHLERTKISFDNDNSDLVIQTNGDTSHLRHLLAKCVPPDSDDLQVFMTMGTPATLETQFDDNTGCSLSVKEVKKRFDPGSILELIIDAFPVSSQCIDVFQSLPLGRITDLTLGRIEGDEAAAAWSHVIPQVVKLKSLDVDKISVLSMLGRPPSPSPAPSSESSEPSPHSHTLTTVHNPALEEISMGEVPLSAEDLLTLKNISRFRCERQSPIRYMWLDCFRGPRKERRRYEREMAGYGTDVEWEDVWDE